MFEGIVRQLLLGYLGRYVKDIQKEQLKIGLWNEEVLLENVELNCEAFDYLQLPFALKEGRVGRLSIKIPWKKLGWEPIIIVLEDVFICACQRDEHEWTLDLVEKREFAGKKAKLATTELAKLSRRVCDKQTGQSFISYFTIKILDGIQVSIRNFHIVYNDQQIDSLIFGLKFSSLTVMKQTLVGSLGAKLRGSEVSKIVEISSLGIYCSTSKGPSHLVGISDVDGSELSNDTLFISDVHNYILSPFDVAASLVVNRSGKLENGAPQYSASAEITALVLQLNEIQLQQILILSDYLCICQLREKYGRYRPSSDSISRKLKGWQRMWWHYAQESVLSDIRKKLRKTSWKYLGWRMNYRRKYVKLYKTKLEFLIKEQHVNEDILLELENMEKECDLDDILGYRSIAELDLQEFLLSSASPSMAPNSGVGAVEKQKTDDSFGRSRGWLNWLFLGMLGAGETADSSQFSDVVSDEVIKDIYEATEFRPVPSLDGGVPTNNKILSSIKFNIHQITATLGSKTCNKEIVRMIFGELAIECRLWEESWTTIALLDSLEIGDPYAKKTILLIGKAFRRENLLNTQPSISVQVDMSPGTCDPEFSLKVVLQPFEVTYAPEFLSCLLEFNHALGTFQSQHQRVLLSLNGIENVNARLVSKAEYIFLKRTKIVNWDVSLNNITINFPLNKDDSQSYFMVLRLGSLQFISRVQAKSLASKRKNLQDYSFINLRSAASVDDISLVVQLQDLYDHFEIALTEVEVNAMMPSCPQVFCVIERFNASVSLTSCIILDESMLKLLEIDVSVSSLIVHFSPSIYGGVIELIDSFDIPQSKSEAVIQGSSKDSDTFQFSVTCNMELVSFHVIFEDCAENSLVLFLDIGELDIRYDVQEVLGEYWCCIKTLKVYTGTFIGETSIDILYLSRSLSVANSVNQHVIGGPSIPTEDRHESSASADGCFLLLYQAPRKTDASGVCNKLTMCLGEADLHIYPNIFGSLIQFFDRISQYGTSSSSNSRNKSPVPCKDTKNTVHLYDVELQKFGFSNYFEAGSTEECIRLDQFPFINLHSSASLGSLEQSLIHGIPEWRSTLNLRDRKSIRIPKFNARKGSRMLSTPAMTFSSCNNVSPVSGDSYGSYLFVIDLNLSGTRAHFHDSSCILGTLTLPFSKALLIIDDTDCLDVFCSIDGLLLSSAWVPQKLNEFLWSSTVPNLSPILNLRVRKENEGGVNRQIELSISIQHVCCILPSEYLAMLIGYFSLPDWTSKTHSGANCVDEDTENHQIGIIYKFEIIDSILILPMESNDHHSLHLKLPQIYINFTPSCKSEDALKDVSPECMVDADKVADRVRLLNLFGRDLSLALVLLESSGQVLLQLDQGSCENISLVAQLDADLWIRIPSESNSINGRSPSTCVMMTVDNCQVIAEDAYFFCGVEAISNVVNNLSSVGRESEGFRSDVLQFLQWKRALKDGTLALPDVSSVTFTEAKFCVNLLSITFCRSRGRNSISSDVVARADIQLKCSALFSNDIPLCLDVYIYSLALCSFHTSVMLVHYTTSNSICSDIEIHLSKTNEVENELVVCLPHLDIWLHLSDWNDVLDLLSSYDQQLDRTSFIVASSITSNSSTPEVPSDLEKSVCQIALDSPRISDSVATSNTVQGSTDLIVKSEDIGISLHFPILAKEESCDMQREPETLCQRTFTSEMCAERNMLEGKYSKYTAVILRGRDTEVVIRGRNVQVKSNMENIRVVLETIEDQKVFSWPFFQLNHINLLVGICDEQQEIMHATAEVLIESLEVWLSYQIFYFWHDIVFRTSQTASSQPSFSNIDFKVHLKKASLLLTDGRWSCNGPLIEILLRSFLFNVNMTGSIMEASVASDLLVNYNNIQKVMWEPFIELWRFQLIMTREHEPSAVLNTSVKTNIHLKSTSHLNFNFTEPLIEVIFRGNEMIKDAWGQVGVNDSPESRRFQGQSPDNACTGRYAPYILQNETSLPLLFQVYRGLVNADNFDIPAIQQGNIVQPGCSVPIYIAETPEEQISRYRPAQFSDRLNEKKSNGVAHHMISVQLDGTSSSSKAMSMDLVGLSYFEVDFSKASDVIEAERNVNASNHNRSIDEKSRTNPNSGFVVPVVFDVSIQRYTKLIRLYSTVILLNATSMPLELRFDIPFGVSPKVLDPIYPGQEFPLPLHLAEAGRMRWRPLGNSYLWSEAHLLSNILLPEKRLGILRSFVCYPSHPSSDPFRCCISIQDITLPSSSGPKNVSSFHIKDTVKKRVIHYVTLTTPLLVRNYLPRDLSLTIESGGVARNIFLSEVDTASIFHIDSTHDLGVVLHVNEFKPCILKFPRADTFTTMAKFSETKFSLSEKLTLYPDSSIGPIYITVDKVMDAICGAREICISVPFLLYNCTGLPLTVAESGSDTSVNGCTIPSCYHLFEEDQFLAREHGLLFLCSHQNVSVTPQNINSLQNSFSKNHTISLRENFSLPSQRFLTMGFTSENSSVHFVEQSNYEVDAQSSLKDSKKILGRCSQLKLPDQGKKGSTVDSDSRKVKACIYAPQSGSSGHELKIKLATFIPEGITEHVKSSLWSSPFFLDPASGSSTVVVPQASTSGAFIISVTTSPVSGPFSGRTRAITFQTRYVISNACSKDICYKQKGTDYVFHLGIGQHSHLHWSDRARDLLVSLRFNEPGWLWSGSFLPDHLGDTQVKMRNYVCDALNMIRVEVQNADVSIRDDEIVGSSHGNSGTNLILLSDDNTGFMPYRIDNFSKEKLRVYQQRCEASETTVYSYTSCPYAWDEPCYPHRLIVEVPGERVLGSYTLDDVKEHIPVYLASTSEKPGRKLFLSSHAEGALKVLSIIDSSCHLLRDMKDTAFPGFKGKNKLDQNQEKFVEYSEKISLHISFIGISLINSYPQELLYACANETKIDILQSVDQQKFCFQISSLQIDNQLPNTPYPVILSFDHDYKSTSAGYMKNKDTGSKIDSESVMQNGSDSSCEPIFCLSAAKWRNKEISLVSFEYISIRLAALRLELEEELILGLFDFIRTVISRLQRNTLPHLRSALFPVAYAASFQKESSEPAQDFEFHNLIGNQLYSLNASKVLEYCSHSPPLPSIVPIGAPWQKIYLLARRKKKIYVEVFDLAPIRLTFSFSSVPWMLRNKGPTPAGFLGHVNTTSFQRGLMALADVEGAPVYLRQLTITHHMASWESFQDILMKHYTRQLLHEMYKIFGSAGVIGNPMGFARNMGLGIKDFLSVPARGLLQSPAGLITGMAEGTTSLISNTVYAVSNAATQFSKAAHKSIVAFTFDDQAVSKIEKQRTGLAAHNKGVLNEFLEGLTGFLQSPIKGAEKHGLLGVLSGIALGTAGVVARPVASIFEVTGRTAQSIRNRSSLHHPHRFRVRFPRPLAKDRPLRPYSWEEAIGTSMLMEADDTKLKDEIFVMCKALKQQGNFVIVTEQRVLVVRCESLVGLGTPEFCGVADPEWLIEVEMSLENVIHVDREDEVLNIVGSNSETLLKLHLQKRGTRTTKRLNCNYTLLPLVQMSMELASKEEAADALQVLLSMIEAVKARGLGVHVLHQTNLRGS